MIRLTHQFDAPQTRPTVASPTVGGCCCCCCCCVVTSISACVLTARAVGVGIDKMTTDAVFEPTSETVVSAQANFREPAAREVPVSPTRVPDMLPYMLLGFFLPVIPWLVVWASFVALSSVQWEVRSRFDWIPFGLGIITYIALGAVLFKKARFSPLFMVLMPIVWAAVSFGEAWVWIVCLK